MAKAQLENGYTMIANELLESICGAKLSQNEFRVLVAIIRLSYGWRQKDTGNRAGVGEIQKIASLPTNRIYQAIDGLKEQNIIFYTKGYPNKYAINTKIGEWKLVQKVDQCKKRTSAENVLVQKVDYELVQKVDYELVQKVDYELVQKVDYSTYSNSALGADDQTPKEIKEIKERKKEEKTPPDFSKIPKTIKALGLPVTAILSPRDHDILNALLSAGCTYEDIEAARLKRKKNRLEWIQDTVCEMRDARQATATKVDKNGIPVFPDGRMDWDNMTYDQKSTAMELGYSR